MILHIGEDIVVGEDDIIMILDGSSARHNKRYIERAIKENRLCGNEKEVKSYVITKARNNQTKIFASPVSSSTLMKRTNY